VNARAELPPISRTLLRAFAWYGDRFVRRHVHTVRLAGVRPAPGTGPLMVVLNHPSWWDPMIALVLALRLWPEREHYAPIDAKALERYRFFARLGFFGLDPESPAGARSFLRRVDAIFARPAPVLWITAQGRFADPRERPAGLRAGAGHAARRLRSGTILPLALEYPFWEERSPEALCRFGEPLAVDDGSMREAGDWSGEIERRLIAAQDALAVPAMMRDRAAFETILAGRAGVGGIYDLWRSLRARLRGETFRREHGERVEPEK
jgi:1-acyl-sn-glycerol-3-phosphate acyltransferase